MQTGLQNSLDALVSGRIKERSAQINNSLSQIAGGNPLGAETDGARMVRRLQSKTGTDRRQAEALADGIAAKAATLGRTRNIFGGPAIESAQAPADGSEAIWGSTLDFVGVAFLAKGRRVADAVARVAFRNGRPQGTGFMVAPGLFLTNHHVIESAEDAAQYCTEFDYETGLRGESLRVTRYAFDPAACFVSDGIDGLDFTLIAVGTKIDGDKALQTFGWVPLSDAGDKHMLGEVANIVQHPNGRLKEVVLRENQLVARDELHHVLHYVADTEPGASGSPVFNNQWEAVALHHWGGPWHEERNAVGTRREINEGIRISAIVKFLRASVPKLTGATKTAVAKALELWDSSNRGFETVMAPPAQALGQQPVSGGLNAVVNADGAATWTIPIELTVRLPVFGSNSSGDVSPGMKPTAGEQDRVPLAEAKQAKEDFSTRQGYEPGFIPGFMVPLPKLDRGHTPARNLQAKPADDPHELAYHHFSIVMNAERRLCYFTACNVDGKSLKAVNRSNKTTIDNPTPQQLGVEAFGSEASDDFRPDPRIAADEQMTIEFYENQNVPGFPDKKSAERRARIFQKGHIVLRGDPAWGIEAMALAAERDTFFYTNAAPQVGFFNQGSGLSNPGEKGKLRWRAVETYVLRNALTMKERVTVFAGPVFAADDPDYRFGSKVPMRFWKIAVWAGEDDLHSIALIADQSSVLKVMPEAMPDSEAFTDENELTRVTEFLTTVAEIEKLTKLDFGNAVRKADVRAGGGSESALDSDPLSQLTRAKPMRADKSSAKSPKTRRKPPVR